jgi:glycosyltransferase involved in cell wall biosynthesis
VECIDVSAMVFRPEFMRVVVVGALPSSLLNFRRDLLINLVDLGCDVVTMASGASADEVNSIEELGVKYIDYPVQRNGLNPIADFKTLMVLSSVLKNLKPDIVLAYTIKAVVWGGIATRTGVNTRFYALITGLGFAFQGGSFKRELLSRAVQFLYRAGLSRSSGVIFQNPDNKQLFQEKGIVRSNITHVVNGSGVNLSYFTRSPVNLSPPIFLCIARLLGEKGLREYVQAAAIVKKKHPEVVFQILGATDPSPDRIKEDELQRWIDEKNIVYLGCTNDVRPYLRQSSVFVLPSYHEGMPRTVLEAMAVGRPIITTNVPGCRETTINLVNGFLVEKQSVDQLVDKILWFLDNKSKWQSMADKSYEIAVARYDVVKVNRKIMNILGFK